MLEKPASTDTSVGLPPPAADNVDGSTDIVADTQPNAGVIARWTLDEDALLTSAFMYTPKRGNGHRIEDWITIAMLVPGGRTKGQCKSRWHHALVSNIDPTRRRHGWVSGQKMKTAS
jgi:hypothetical protein